MRTTGQFSLPKPPNPREMVKRDTGHLRLALQKLDTVTIPELVRPPVPHGAPPTNELVIWAVKVYFYSALCQFRELLRATLSLVDADHISAVFFCCRGLFELAAHAYYVKKHVLQYVKAKNPGLAWQFLFEVNLGSRDVREKQRAQGAEPTYPEGPHIAKVMACFNEYFPNGQKEKQATETYSSLSEFSHPNCFAFINHFEWEIDLRDMSKVTFGRPSRNLLTLCLPAACIAVMAFLHSAGKLVGELGDGGLFKTIEQIVEELLESAESIAKPRPWRTISWLLAAGALILILLILFSSRADPRCASLLAHSDKVAIPLPPNCIETLDAPAGDTVRDLERERKQGGLILKSWIICKASNPAQAPKPSLLFDQDPRWLPSYAPGTYQFRRTVVIRSAQPASRVAGEVCLVPWRRYAAQIAGQCDGKFAVWK